LIRLWRAKHNNRLVLTYALATNSVSLAIAEFASSDPAHSPALIVSDYAEVTAGNWAEAIQQLTSKYARYSKGNPAVVLVLAPSLYQSVQLERPNLPPEEVSQALRYNLRDLVSLQPGDIIADYYDVPVQMPGQDKLNAIVADRKVLEPVLSVLHEISDNIVGIISEEQAIAPLFQHVAEASVVAYQHGQEPALLQVYLNGQMQVNRVVRNLEQLSQLTADEIDLGGASPLSVEVQRSADYFERQLRQRPVSNLVLAVGLKHRAGVQKQLSEDLGLEASWIDYPEWAQELGAGDCSDFPVLGAILLTQALREAKQVAA
jgi:MSHA biogenesis protein MshI